MLVRRKLTPISIVPGEKPVPQETPVPIPPPAVLQETPASSKETTVPTPPPAVPQEIPASSKGTVVPLPQSVVPQEAPALSNENDVVVPRPNTPPPHDEKDDEKSLVPLDVPVVSPVSHSDDSGDDLDDLPDDSGDDQDLARLPVLQNTTVYRENSAEEYTDDGATDNDIGDDDEYEEVLGSDDEKEDERSEHDDPVTTEEEDDEDDDGHDDDGVSEHGQESKNAPSSEIKYITGDMVTCSSATSRWDTGLVIYESMLTRPGTWSHRLNPDMPLDLCLRCQGFGVLQDLPKIVLPDNFAYKGSRLSLNLIDYVPMPSNVLRFPEKMPRFQTLRVVSRFLVMPMEVDPHSFDVIVLESTGKYYQSPFEISGALNTVLLPSEDADVAPPTVYKLILTSRIESRYDIAPAPGDVDDFRTGLVVPLFNEWVSITHMHLENREWADLLFTWALDVFRGFGDRRLGPKLVYLGFREFMGPPSWEWVRCTGTALMITGMCALIQHSPDLQTVGFSYTDVLIENKMFHSFLMLNLFPVLASMNGRGRIQLKIYQSGNRDLFFSMIEAAVMAAQGSDKEKDGPWWRKYLITLDNPSQMIRSKPVLVPTVTPHDLEHDETMTAEAKLCERIDKFRISDLSDRLKLDPETFDFPRLVDLSICSFPWEDHVTNKWLHVCAAFYSAAVDPFLQKHPETKDKVIRLLVASMCTGLAAIQEDIRRKTMSLQVPVGDERVVPDQSKYTCHRQSRSVLKFGCGIQVDVDIIETGCMMLS